MTEKFINHSAAPFLRRDETNSLAIVFNFFFTISALFVLALLYGGLIIALLRALLRVLVCRGLCCCRQLPLRQFVFITVVFLIIHHVGAVFCGLPLTSVDITEAYS